jgi:hypothetical protein
MQFLWFQAQCSIGSIHFKEYIPYIMREYSTVFPITYNVYTCVSRIIAGIRIWKCTEPIELHENRH